MVHGLGGCVFELVLWDIAGFDAVRILWPVYRIDANPELRGVWVCKGNTGLENQQQLVIFHADHRSPLNW